MKRLIALAILLYGSYLSAQVGIGNTDPKANLDITASNSATPANTDGILIPRIDEFPSTDPGVDQDGMLVFATGNGTPAKGFYYWNNGSTSWDAVAGGSSDADWYEVGTGAPADNISDNVYTQGHVSIGTATSSSIAPLYVIGDADDGDANIFRNSVSGTFSIGTFASVDNSSFLTGTGSYTAMTSSLGGSISGTIKGVRNAFTNSGGGQKIGLENVFNSSDGVRKGIYNYFSTGSSISIGIENVAPGAFTIDGAIYGVDNDLSAAGNGQRYGVFTVINSLGSGAKYGERIQINSTAGGQHYGIYADVQKASGYAGYFLGRLSLGNTTSNRYIMPGADGTAGQVLTTNGSGQLSFTDASGVEKLDDLSDAKSDNDGTNNGSSIFIGVNAGATDNSDDNMNVGVGYNSLTSINAGFGNVAVGYNALPSLFGWDNTAIGANALDGLSSGFQNVALGAYTMPNLTTGSANTIIGYRAGSNATNTTGNVFIGKEAGTWATGGNKLFIENSPANADNALIYGEFDNDILRTNGELQIGNPTGTGYALPSIDGSAGQVLTTDGAGQLSFSSPASTSEWTDGGSYISPSDGNNEEVLIGTTTSNEGKLLVASGSKVAAIEAEFSGSAAYGLITNFTGTTSGLKFGVYNNIGGNTLGFSSWGTYNNVTTEGNGSRIATYNIVNSTGTGNKYATWNYIPSTDPGTHYGIYSDAQSASGFAAYLVGRTSLGNTTANRYLMPAADGTIGQVMTTDGAGNISFQDVPGDGIGTDDQTIDNLGIMGNVLGISLENDGQPAQTVDLSNVDFNVSNFALAKMTMSANQSLLAGAFTKLNFDTADFDIGSNFNATADRFDVTETGYYRITASFNSLAPNATLDLFDLYITVSGTVIKSDFRNHSGNGYVKRIVETVTYIPSGQYIEIMCYSQSALTVNSFWRYTTFEVERIR